MEEWMPFLPLVQFVFCFGVSCFTFISLSGILRQQGKQNEKIISFPVGVNMISWLWAAGCDLLYSGTSIYVWKYSGRELAVYPTTPEAPTFVVFGSGSLYFAATTAVSLSVTFLLSDRCIILLSPQWWRPKVRRRVRMANAVLVVLDFFAVLSLFWILEKPDFGQTECPTFSCVSVLHARSLNVSRMVYGTVNSIMAAIFSILLRRYNRRRQSSIVPTNNYERRRSETVAHNSRSNYIAGLSVLSEILFNFLPNLCAFVALEAFGMTLSSRFGPIVSTFSQLDALCTTLVYRMIIGRRLTVADKSTHNTATYGHTTHT